MGVDGIPPWGDAEHSAYMELEARVGKLEATMARPLPILVAGTESQSQRDRLRAMLPPLPDGVTDQQPWQQETRRLVDSGKKFAAVKVVLEATGMGLKEAKAYVDRTYRLSQPTPRSRGWSP